MRRRKFFVALAIFLGISISAYGSVRVGGGLIKTFRRITMQRRGRIIMKDDTWIGLGSAKGRIVFDDQATDEIIIYNALLNLRDEDITNIGDMASDSWSPDATNLSIIIGAGVLGIGDDTYSWDHAPMVGIEGKLEVDGSAHFDGSIVGYDDIYLATDYGLKMNITGNALLQFDTTQTTDSSVFWTDITSRTFILGDGGSLTKNYDHSGQTNPTFFGHSVTDPDDSNSEYYSKTHDQLDTTYKSGFGGHSFEVDAQPARGTITVTGIATAEDIFVINNTTITAKADGSGDLDWFTIGGSASAAVTNMVATINEGSESTNCHAYNGVGDKVVVEWLTKGTAGNTIIFTEALDGATIDGGGTLGGTHAGVAASVIMTLAEAGRTTVAEFVRSLSTNYRRYFHLAIGSFDPGASGATWATPDANTCGGWGLDAVGETLEGTIDIHADWDGASDPNIEVCFDIALAGTAPGDTVDIKIVFYYKGTGDTSTKTQTVEIATTVDDDAQWTHYVQTTPINWDETDNVLEVGDCIGVIINLETDTSEVDSIVVTSLSFSYDTTHVGIESGDI